MNNLKLIVLENSLELGNKINQHLSDISSKNENFLLPITNSRFSNGEGKVRLEESVREKDLYILADVGNYHMIYSMHGTEHHMSPDEHFQDILRVISSASGHASKITVIMPLLYQSRQHKRKGRESLDCALALQTLEKMGVNQIITFDVHDPNVSNAIPRLPFENFYPTHLILKEIVAGDLDLNQLLVISPDMGAMERARYYAEMLGSDVGVFYKRRDLSRVVNGKNPIVDHVYMGVDVKDKNILVVDDMIASGTSMIEVAKELKERGAAEIYLIATFTLLTEGPTGFVEAFQSGYFNHLYSTNLSYVPDSIKQEPWYHEVDCSAYLARIIYTLNQKQSIAPLQDGKSEVLAAIEEDRKK